MWWNKPSSLTSIHGCLVGSDWYDARFFVAALKKMNAKGFFSRLNLDSSQIVVNDFWNAHESSTSIMFDMCKAYHCFALTVESLGQEILLPSLRFFIKGQWSNLIGLKDTNLIAKGDSFVFTKRNPFQLEIQNTYFVVELIPSVVYGYVWRCFLFSFVGIALFSAFPPKVCSHLVDLPLSCWGFKKGETWSELSE